MVGEFNGKVCLVTTIAFNFMNILNSFYECDIPTNTRVEACYEGEMMILIMLADYAEIKI
ncbi:CLUMA_CG013615, isoform A [Clunio marinus]|uniref:CLUMA_CG013615, isoform A n=1 Tax=Clunio marinus TaxID=568069 RepID=A0A1J1IMM4_9DIPT|nr:CLUMA_CG013615, isoform A [Clunio marinus]